MFLIQVCRFALVKFLICFEPLFPFPGGEQHVFQGVFQFPAKCFNGIVVIGIDGYYITWPAGADDVVEVYAAYFFEGADGFQYGESVAAAQVEHFAAFGGFTFFEETDG